MEKFIISPSVLTGACLALIRKTVSDPWPLEARVIQDFLPPPEELAFREEGVKVTLALNKKSVDFFKAEAGKHHSQYQRMIRKLIDSYADAYSKHCASQKL